MLSPADRKRLVPLLESLIPAIEDLTRGGLSTASEGTRQHLAASFQEASRLKLLRLGSALRVANQELGRFTSDDPTFSSKRLLLFLSHAWILAQGLLRALDRGDEAEWEVLTGAPSRRPLEWVEVVSLGVVKKVVPGAFCAFEFRLRVLESSDPALALGARTTWSCVFPLPPSRLAPETYLHTEQKQKFRPRVFLPGKRVRIEGASLSADQRGGPPRILLEPTSEVHEGAEFSDWETIASWDPRAALAEVRAHAPGPLDLEVEPTHELVLREWSLGDLEEREGRPVFPLESEGVECEVRCAPGEVDAHLIAELKKLGRAKKRPPLYTLAHYARCGIVLTPLAVLEKEGPRVLNISQDRAGAAELVRRLNLF